MIDLMCSQACNSCASGACAERSGSFLLCPCQLTQALSACDLKAGLYFWLDEMPLLHLSGLEDGHICLMVDLDSNVILRMTRVVNHSNVACLGLPLFTEKLDDIA